MSWWKFIQRSQARNEPLSDEETSEVRHTPRSVRELLTEMKDTSEHSLDLAWAAIAFDSADFAQQVDSLEGDMDRLLYEIRIAVMLAARDRESAEQLAGLLQVASAAEQLTDAASELVQLLGTDLSQRLELPFMLREGDEMLETRKVPVGSPFERVSLRELALETSSGVRVVALQRGRRWMFDVEADQRLHENDILMVRGTNEGFARLDEMLAPLNGGGDLLE